MRPQTIGRVLGTGLRVAGRIAGERLAASAQSAAAQQAQPQAQPNASATARVQTAGQTAKRANTQASGGVARGVGGFLRPFRRVGGILWLEVTGVFFLLPVIVFSPNLWRMRASWAHGPDHRMFLITLLVVVVFLYLGVSSFWRARRR
jgi:outer membrane murein-binding lipoprotein Lpp